MRSQKVFLLVRDKKRSNIYRIPDRNAYRLIVELLSLEIIGLRRPFVGVRLVVRHDDVIEQNLAAHRPQFNSHRGLQLNEM